MRNFTVRTIEPFDPAPADSLFILAADEGRARELARQELVRQARWVSFELREAGKLVGVGSVA